MAQISDQQFKILYEQFQKLKNNLGSDPEFAKFLNDKNIQPGVLGKETGLRNETFTTKTVNGRRQRLKIKTPTAGKIIGKTLANRTNIENLLQKEITKANNSDKLISQKEISIKVEDKLKLNPKIVNGKRIAAFVSSKGGTAGAYPILLELDSPQEKVDKVLKDLLIDETPLKNRLVEVVKNKTKVGDTRTTLRVIRATPTFAAIADQGGEILVNAANMVDYQNLNLSDQLTRALDKQLGQPVYTGLGGVKSRFYSPAYVAMKFAKENWNRNKGQGPIQFFNKKGDIIEWKSGLKLPIRNVSFKYNNKTHTYNNLNDTSYMKKNFPEVYEKTLAVNKLKNTKIDNPFKPGTKINVRDLVKKVQVDGYKWSPKFPTLDILHGPKGIKQEPFTNLRYNTKDINQLEAGLSQKLNANNLTKTQYNQAVKELNKPFTKGNINQAIIDRVTTQANKIKEGTFYGYDTLKDNILKLNKTDVRKVCRALGAFNVGGDVAGCAAAIEADPVKAATALEEIKPTSAALGKVRNAASAFLKFAGKGKVFGATAAVGVGAGALVKKFMNDDPSTYLTNDAQANAMILDTIDEKERQERMEAMGDAPELLDEARIAGEVGVTAAAIPGSGAVYGARKKPFTRMVDGVKKTRPAMGTARAALGPVGKALSGFATPAGIAALTPLNVASSLYEGDSGYEIATDPLNYLAPAFAGTLSKEATRGMGAASKLSKVLRLGMSPGAIKMVSRRFGLPGLALSGGISLYELADDYKMKRGMFGKKE